MTHTNVTIYGIQFSWQSTLENSSGCFHTNPASFVWVFCVDTEKCNKLNGMKSTLNYYFYVQVYLIERALGTYSKALGEKKKNRNHPKTIPVSQELCHIFSLWKFEWCITTAMNHSSSTEPGSRLRGSSHKSYEIKVENNHPDWNSDLMDVNLWFE